MKTYSTIFCFLFIFSFSHAQFIFNAANSNPIAGDNYTEYNADTTGINPGAAGANQIWDFHSLNINTSSSIVHSFVAPLPACYLPPYSTATIEDSITHEYYLTDSAFMSFLGHGASGIIYTGDTILFYPFSYGSNHQINCSVSSHCGGPLAGTETTTITYDGYGTLILPGITYSNVARISESIHYHFAYGQSKYSDGDAYIYKWYENNIKFPILTISAPGVSLAGYYRTKTVLVQNYAGVGINDLSNDNVLSLYPNPTNGKISICTNTRGGEISIYNGFGEKIFLQTNQTEKSEIDLSNQPNGLYFLQLKTEQGITSRKIVINK
jgi:hypothetical protein